MKSVAGDCFSRHRRSCGACGASLRRSRPIHARPENSQPRKTRAKAREREREKDLPSVHGEISVEHLFAHLFPLDSAGKFQVCELVSQQLRLHETLQADVDHVRDRFTHAMTHSETLLFFCHKAEFIELKK